MNNINGSYGSAGVLVRWVDIVKEREEKRAALREKRKEYLRLYNLRMINEENSWGRDVNQLGYLYIKKTCSSYAICNCCNILVRKDRVRKSGSINHEYLIDGTDICIECYSGWETGGKFCKRDFIRNGLYSGCGVKELELGYMELQIIRLIQPFASVLFQRCRMQHVKGQFLHVCSDPVGNFSALLPHSPEFSVMQVCQPKPKVGTYTGLYSVNLNKVYSAIGFLVGCNAYYRDVKIRTREEVEKEYADRVGVLENVDIENNVAFLNFGIVPSQLHHFGNQRILPFNDVKEWIEGISAGVEEKSYPHLFPYGTGGFKSYRKYEVSLCDYIGMRLLSKEKMFQKDLTYVFWLLNMFQRHLMQKSINYVLREGQQFLNCEGNKGRLVKRLYARVGRQIRGSQIYFEQARQHLRNMMTCNGVPDLFLSINLRNCPELLCYARPEVFGNVDGMKVGLIDDTGDDIVRDIINENCGMAAKMFEKRMISFATFLKSKTSRAFPDNVYALDVFIKVEFQRAGYPHLHCVVWLSEDFDRDTAGGQQRILSFLDKFLTTEIPDVGIDPEGYLLVSKHQQHCHTFTCRKGGKKRLRKMFSGRKKLKNQDKVLETLDNVDSSDEDVDLVLEVEKGISDEERKEEFERYICRFGYPQRLSLTSRFLSSKEIKKGVRGDRMYTLRRIDEESRRIVPYNLGWLRTFRCNMDCQFVMDKYAAIEYLFSYVTKPESKEKDLIEKVVRGAGENVNLRSLLYKAGNAVLTSREVGKMEAAMLCLGIPLYMCSTSSVYVDLRMSSKRSLLLNSKFSLRKVITEDQVINGMLDCYKKRCGCLSDSSVEKRMSEMTFFEFCTWFVKDTKSKKSVGENVDDNDVYSEYEAGEEQKVFLNDSWRLNRKNPPFESSTIYLPRLRIDGMVFRMRNRPRNVCFFIHQGSAMEKIYSICLLLVPFIGEGELDFIFSNVVSEEDMKRVFLEQVSVVRKHLEFVPEAYKILVENQITKVFSDRKQATVWKRDVSDSDTDDDDMSQEVDGLGSGTEDYVLPVLENLVKEDLTKEQLEVFEVVERYLGAFYEYMFSRFRGNGSVKKPEPFYLFIQGAAGTGKTFLIRKLRDLILRYVIAEKIFAAVPRFQGGCLLAAPTGCAAHNIGGVTLHEMFGLGIDSQYGISYVSAAGAKLQNLRNKLNNALLLIIDEISMVSSGMFCKIHQRLNEVNNVSGDGIFGRLPVIVLGDLFQLRPVTGQFVFMRYRSSPVSLWEFFDPYFFLTNKRQEDDIEFREALEDMRKPEYAKYLSERLVKLLNSRTLNAVVNPQFEDLLTEYREVFTDSVHLFALRYLADEHNCKKLKELSAKVLTPIWRIRCIDKFDCNKMGVKKQKLNPSPSKDIKATGGLLEDVYIMSGCRVMLTQNIDVYGGLVNGAVGTVVGIRWISEENGDLSDKNVRNFVKTTEQGIWGAVLNMEMPAVIDIKFDGRDSVSSIEVAKTHYKDTNGNSVIRIQFPIVLAYGITIHKSQGLTLSKGVIHLKFSRFKPQGAFYVAVSRFKTRNSFVLLDYDQSSFKCCEDAATEIIRLKELTHKYLY